MNAPKLTKKQKKGLAFRERKDKKKGKELDDEELAIPEADPPVEETQEKPVTSKAPEQKPSKPEPPAKKRKREAEEASVSEKVIEEESAEPKASPKKKRKVDAAEKVDGKLQETGKDEKGNGKEQSDKSRFILFVGNLRYTTSVEVIKEHFAKCDPPPTVRLLTPKPKAPGAPTPKSKGCAFLEFSHRNALQQGLKLHGSTLEGRQINVELTAGGGGKSENRLQKVQARNKQLLEERKTRVQKKLEAGDETEADMIARPQRHSTTSGMDVVPLKKRTWSVPEGEEESGRGGMKQRGKKGKNKVPGRSWGSGANSIPVG